MDVELLLAEAVHRNTVWVADELRAEDIAVEGVRARPLGDMDHAVIEADLDQASLLLTASALREKRYSTYRASFPLRQSS